MGLSNSGTIGSLNNAGTIDPRAGAFAILSIGSIGTITNTGQIVGNVEIDDQAMVTVVGGRGNTFGEWTGGAITIGGGDLTFARGHTALGDNIVVTGADGGPGTVFNNARLMIAAPQTITGNFGQSTTGALDFGLAGDMAGQYGALRVTGSATLDGGLGLELMNGFDLTAGNSFDLMTYGGFDGDFARVSVDGEACSAARGDVWRCSVGVDLDVDLGGGGLIVTTGPFTELPATAAVARTADLDDARAGLPRPRRIYAGRSKEAIGGRALGADFDQTDAPRHCDLSLQGWTRSESRREAQL